MNLRRSAAAALSRGVGLLGLRGPGERVLLYHGVGAFAPGDTYGMTVSTSTFRGHLAALLTSGLPVRHLCAGSETADVAITFDDGLASVLDNAAPILSEAKLPFTVFVTTEWLDRPHYLTARGLRELAGLEEARVGSHGVSHRRLTRCPPDQLGRELKDSRARLEDLLQQPITALAYPHGAVDSRVRAAVAHAGYDLGVTSRFGSNRSGIDRLMLRRCEVVRDDSPRIVLEKARGAWDWLGVRPNAK